MTTCRTILRHSAVALAALVLWPTAAAAQSTIPQPASDQAAGALLRALETPSNVSPALNTPAGDVFAALSSEPGASAWVRTKEADVRLLAARTAVSKEDTVRLGLQFDLKPGWKVYWRSPGDAGYPPTIDWSGSQNLAETAIAWPVPHRFELFGIQTAGYKDQVVLPITARLERPGEPLHLKAAVDYLICSDICVPGKADLTLDLPAGSGKASPQAHLIDRYQATVPGPGRGIALEGAVLQGSDKAQSIAVTVTADPPLTAPDLFVEGPHDTTSTAAGHGIVSGAPEVRLLDDGRRAILTAALLVPYDATTVPELTVTVTDGNRGLETTATPDVAPAATAFGSGAGVAAFGDLAAIMGLALVGGLILNLMPCVLPVLSLKVMGFVGHGGARRGEVRAAFIASAAGIVAAFLVLAAALASLKAAGSAVGWGIQFQQPLFLTAMIALLTLFAANLWGLFEVPLPSWLAGAGGSLGAPRTLAGHFAAGAFATLLATPCSAPFLGTAVGFALARGPLEIGFIFLALGLGMALPYLGIAAFPALAQRLPRPGPWMIGLKRVLALALAGTAVWLLAVLMAQVGMDGSLVVALLMVGVVAALAARRRIGGRLRAVASAAVALLVVAAFVVPVTERPPRAAPDGGAAVAGLWQTWTPDAVTEHVAQGHVVFVDVTADWCITCKVNKAAVIERGAVLEALQAPGVVALQADWTNPDERIADYLAGFGRYGIPFNAVYGPDAPEGIALPELLTTDGVLQALKKASGRS